MKIVIATRGSALALWQAHTTQALLAAAHPTFDVEIATIQSSGDRDQRLAAASFGKVGIFTVEIDHAVSSKAADVGVHSLKDMSTQVPEGLVLAGVLARGAVEDVLVTRNRETLADLPPGSRIATGSVRRVAMLKRARPDLAVVSIRGNVETRLAKVDRGEAEGLILARAGLERLGLGARICEIFDLPRFLPAVGQGIVGLVCRSDDTQTLHALWSIGDNEAYAEALAERALLARLHGGCNAPVGGHARAVEGAIALQARVLSLDGVESIEDQIHGPIDAAEELGQRLAERLIARGAARLIDAARAQA